MSEVKGVFPKAEITMSVDGYIPMREFIALGVGFGILPQDFGDADPRLMGVSQAITKHEINLWILCLPEQRRLHRIQKLVQFLRFELKS